MAREFHELVDYPEIKDYISAWFKLRQMDHIVKWRIIGDSKLMDLLDIKILPDYCKQIFDVDLIIIVNPFIFEQLSSDQDQFLILLNEQLDVIGYDTKGNIKKIKQDYTTSSYYQEKVGVETLVTAKTIKKEVIESYKQTLKESK